MAPPDLALYVGPGGSFLNDGTLAGAELVPHETVCQVSRGEAETSAWWEPVGKAPKAPKGARARAKPKATTVPSESAGTAEGAGAPNEQTGAPSGALTTGGADD